MCQEVESSTAAAAQEPKARGLRSPSELQREFAQRRARQAEAACGEAMTAPLQHHGKEEGPAPAPAFRNLSDLQRDLCQRHASCAAAEAAPAQAKPPSSKARKAVAAPVPTMRKLEDLVNEYRQRKGGSAALPASASPELRAAGAPTTPAAIVMAVAGARALEGAPSYSREALLGLREALLSRSRPRSQRPRGLTIRTVHAVPAAMMLAAAAPRPSKGVAWGADATEDPSLDDEEIVAKLEARLSRESGADVHNADTFGAVAAAGGWSFEAAVEANARIRSGQVVPVRLEHTEGWEVCTDSFPSFDPCSERRLPRIEGLPHYANLSAGKRGDDSAAERCPSTAVPSGAATPVGSSGSARGTSPSGSATARESLAATAGSTCFQ